MNRYVKFMTAAAAIAAYVLVLRYVAPSREPYFVLGIGLIGYMAWLYGTLAGLATALLLIPATLHIYSQFEVSTSYMGFASSPAYIAIEILAAGMLGYLRNKIISLSRKEASLEEANEGLQTALAGVQEIGGILSLCTSCKKIKADNGDWKQIDTYLMEKTKAEFSHGICPDCAGEYGHASVEKSEV